jgi:predicted GNAT family N-acyltransferase
MEIKIESFTYEESDLIKCAYDLRSEIFIEELGVSKNDEFDGLDSSAVHYIVTINKKVAATARYRETDEGIKIERFGVSLLYRRKAIGLLLLKKIIDDLVPGKKRIFLHATLEAYKFYENHGFEISGTEFFEAKMLHYKMIYKK